MTVLDKSFLWESVLAELQLTLSGANFQTWFNGKTQILSIKDGVIEVGCNSAYGKVWIEERYLGTIKEIINRVTGADFNLIFTVSPIDQNPKPTKSKVLRISENTVPLFEETSNQQILDLLKAANVNSKYTFSNFVVGQSNQLAFAVAKSVADNPFEKYNPLLIHGGVGLGKTHLLQAIAHAIILRRIGTKVLYTTSESFTNDMIEAIKSKATMEFRSKYRGVDVLLIDDVQFIAGRESTQEEFFHTFNHLYVQGKQIVLSSDRNPAQLSNLDQRLRSRFTGGMVAALEPPELELREAILLAKAKEKGVDLDFNIIKSLAASLGESVRDLEGGLLRLLAISKLTGKPIDSNILSVALGAESKKKISASEVLEQTARFFSVSVKNLVGNKRSKDLVFPRQIAMYLLRSGLNLSFKQIAQAFNGKDHTTAIYSVNKVENLVETNGEISRLVEDLKGKIFGG